MRGPRLITNCELGEFFRQEVTEAKDSLKIKLGETAEFYLVNLLCDYSRRERAPGLAEEPLAFLYKRAVEATRSERLQLFKNLGDVALYMAGFFADFVERSLVDVGYYISMGGTAYGNVSALAGGKRNGDDFARLFDELAARFTELVDLFNQIAERSRGKSDRDADLLKLYDRWLRTGSERVRRLLAERGLVPPTDGLSTDYVQ